MGMGEHNALNVTRVFADCAKTANYRARSIFKATVHEGYRAIGLEKDEGVNKTTHGANSIDVGSQGNDGVGHGTSV
ncbi:unannotated protein [freshwater metagenome]|uniref:Unannotated protein n=1 Tax=freshwater metagenome TaxID=449393 RepID=A0A6J6NCV2_9ZZZZ